MKRLPWEIILIAAAVLAAPILAPAASRQTTGRPAERLARDVFEKSVRARLDDRRSRCMSAIGSADFCDCLNADLPWDVDFRKYIILTTTAATGAEADQLLTDEKRISPRVISTRDRCVAKVFAPPRSK
jgi:hypothetical protein